MNVHNGTVLLRELKALEFNASMFKMEGTDNCKVKVISDGKEVFVTLSPDKSKATPIQPEELRQSNKITVDVTNVKSEFIRSVRSCHFFEGKESVRRYLFGSMSK